MIITSLNADSETKWDYMERKKLESGLGKVTGISDGVLTKDFGLSAQFCLYPLRQQQERENFPDLQCKAEMFSQLFSFGHKHNL